MALIQVQENIIKAKKAIETLENDSLYRAYKSFGGHGNFEMELRKIFNSSIELRNKVIANVQGMIMKTKDKDLIKIIEAGYFDKITEAVSKESLIKVISFGSASFTIPETVSKMVAESKEIGFIIHQIVGDISHYNNTLVSFRQQRNKMFFTLYNLPPLRELPEPIEEGISLHSLLDFSDRAVIIPTKTTRIKDETPIETFEPTSKLKISKKLKP